LNWLPQDMSTATLVGYELNAGTTIKVTELEAEP
jgi:hypothetical protein